MMSLVAIPEWTAGGVLPPIDALDPTSTSRSPYRVSPTDLVLRFGTSPERKSILNGFLGFRAALHDVGLTEGFQWLDGSFLEQVEILESREPRDIDVVTFFRLPAGETQRSIHARKPELFDHDYVASTYFVDSYFMHLDSDDPRNMVWWSAYWYSVWSHRRNYIWKGFVELDLRDQGDATAEQLLAGRPADTRVSQ
jgi:hypothetical protein